MHFNHILHSCLFQHGPVTGLQNGALLSIILAGRGLLVKIIITLESYILIKFCILIHFNIVATLVCKTVTRVC